MNWKDEQKKVATGVTGGQEPVALETVYETIIHWDEGGGKRSRRELARRIEALYAHPQPKREQDEAYKAAAYLAKTIFDSLYANKEPYVSGKVVWELCDTTVGVITQIDNMVSQFSPRHTQPKREWVGLTDEERHEIREWQKIQEELGPVWAPMMLYLYEAIEAKLKEKNT